MKLKTAFLIIGAEGSGTYMLAEAFVSAGCIYCDKDDIDEFLKDNQPNNLVVRRSFPHAGKWITTGEIVLKLKKHHYIVRQIAIRRDKYCTQKSVLRRNPKASPDDYDIAQALIQSALHVWSGILIEYEGFVKYKEVRERVFSRYNLPLPEMEFYDGNKKYFE